MTQRIIDKMAAQPLSRGCCATSGRWYIQPEEDMDIRIEEGADVELLIVDKALAVNLDIEIERGAHLRIVEVVTERSAMQLSVAVGADAECRMTQIVLSPSDMRVAASLVAAGARFELNGAFILTAEEQGSVTVDVNHLSADCVSRTSVKGVASGKAHGSFSGLVYVAPDAQHTDSAQSSRNIVIGDAHIETLPQLEIYADDVKCSHGATVGQMDADAILYMRQRGLSLADAKRLQIEGFISDVVLHASIESLVEPLEELLSVKFNSL
ncbi:MAG: SufD family Fe-S cluster assembly protein [Alistipes sp.]|nr:SufD family Fe-S cluster assembly protein [Alistipes sp.]